MQALTKYEEARAALAVCVKVDEVKAWQDKAAGMAAYAKQANDPELLVYAQKIRLQAQRRARDEQHAERREQPEPDKQPGEPEHHEQRDGRHRRWPLGDRLHRLHPLR